MNPCSQSTHRRNRMVSGVAAAVVFLLSASSDAAAQLVITPPRAVLHGAGTTQLQAGGVSPHPSKAVQVEGAASGKLDARAVPKSMSSTSSAPSNDPQAPGGGGVVVNPPSRQGGPATPMSMKGPGTVSSGGGGFTIAPPRAVAAAHHTVTLILNRDRSAHRADSLEGRSAIAVLRDSSGRLAAMSELHAGEVLIIQIPHEFLAAGLRLDVPGTHLIGVPIRGNAVITLLAEECAPHESALPH